MIRSFLIKFAAKFVPSIKYSLGLSHIGNMRTNYRKIKN